MTPDKEAEREKLIDSAFSRFKYGDSVKAYTRDIVDTFLAREAKLNERLDALNKAYLGCKTLLDESEKKIERLESENNLQKLELDGCKIMCDCYVNENKQLKERIERCMGYLGKIQRTMPVISNCECFMCKAISALKGEV